MARYTVVREIKKNSKGGIIWVDDKWQLKCLECDWKGRKVVEPSVSSSKQRLKEWDRHAATHPRSDDPPDRT